MRILFDQGTPVPLRHLLSGHDVSTAQNLRYQQDLAGRRLAILVLPTTSWPKLRANQEHVVAGISALLPGEFVELSFS